MIILITGASGAGKTTLVKNLQAQFDLKSSHFAFFDEIGVPSFEDMILEYGSPEKWQEFATHQWIEKLSKIDKDLIILEGQFNPEFAIAAINKNKIKDYKIICIHADNNIRNKRLIENRKQPELADERMDIWAEFLKDKTSQIGGIVLDNSGDIDFILRELIGHIKIN